MSKEKTKDELSIDEEKLRLLTAQADKIELENAIKRREYVAVKAADKFYSDMVYGFRNKILTIPRILGKELADETDPIICEDLLSKTLEITLLELSTSCLSWKLKDSVEKNGKLSHNNKEDA